eukprot:jgi/Picsp_1/1607/NSC_05085-R1_---NA---
MMKVSIFAKLAMLVLLFAVVTRAKTCGSGSEGKAVRRNKYMSKKYNQDSTGASAKTGAAAKKVAGPGSSNPTTRVVNATCIRRATSGGIIPGRASPTLEDAGNWKHAPYAVSFCVSASVHGVK